MPRTRCSRASSSTSGSAPRVAVRGLCVGGFRVSGLRVSGLRVSALRVSALRVGALRVSGSLRVGGSLARGARVRVGGLSLAPGGLGRLARGPALLGALLGFLAGLALLGRGREALPLVRARLGGAEGALGPRLPGE